MRYLTVTLSVFFLFLSHNFAQAGDLLNKSLPDNLRMDLQVRYRMEFKDNFDFNDTGIDKDIYHLIRTRFSVDYLPVKQIEIFGQLQDSRVEDMKYYPESTAVHFLDFRQLYLALNDVLPPKGLMPHSKIIFGRQSLNFGSGRLVGDPDWSNIGQTFDSGRVVFIWNDSNIKLDLFGGNITPNKSPREANDFFDRSVKDTLGGYYASWAVDKKLTIDQYLFTRKTNKNISFGPSGSGELEEYTLGARILGRELKGFDYELELAGQGGNFKDQKISALMGIAILGYTFNAPWKPRLSAEYNYASGDTDPTDGTRHTFDNLYPANHVYYGYMDLVGLQNLNNYRVGLGVNPTNKLKITVDDHFIYLDTSKDSFYSASRSVVRTASFSSNISSYVGNELDLWSSYKVCPYVTIALGYSHFFAGKYLAKTGANDDADFVYTSLTLNF